MKEEKKKELEALIAITAFRQLDGLGVLTISGRKIIKQRINTLYGKYLSPIRTEQK